ncbi:MAG: multiubiquitin domain-containing protein [Armatimonadetes bacterium]|nr:multiubiquitin domain-containing protein [Armatimonadota bacterium]MDE2206241.1 multiubiquitin domain-containing protein [Armatimonadota bacterium]
MNTEVAAQPLAEQHVKEFHIKVNSGEKTVDHNQLTFKEVVGLAYPNPVFNDRIQYTVIYDRADQTPERGSLIAGQTLIVKNGTSINVDRTDRS